MKALILPIALFSAPTEDASRDASAAQVGSGAAAVVRPERQRCVGRATPARAIPNPSRRRSRRLDGLFIGNDPADVAKAERWLSRSLDIVAAHTGRASWTDWSGSVGWQIRNLRGIRAPLRWSIPLFANGGTLADAAAHRYDGYYRDAARTLVDAYPGERRIVVRTGEEFNGDWMPWSAAGKEASFAAAYRGFVTAFRSVSPRFRFEWNVNYAKDGAVVERAYPGDAYVDYVGMDFYWDATKAWSITDPVAAFEDIRTARYGLAWLETFAAAHGKPSAYSEWGVNSPDAGPFVELTKRWFDAHRVAYAIYWDSNSDFAGKLSDGAKGATSATYRRLFGGCDD